MGYDAVIMLASLKFGETLSNRSVAKKWLVRMAKSGTFAGWPIKYKENLKRENTTPRYTHSKYTDYINNSLKWQKIRAAILERDKHRCQKCKKNYDLHVHHITYDHLFNEENYPQDLITLCKNCHKALHDSDDKDRLNEQLKTIVPKSLKVISMVFSEAELEMMKAGRKAALNSRNTSKSLSGVDTSITDELIKEITRNEAQRLIYILNILISLSSIKSMRTLSQNIMSKLINKFGLK